MQSMCKYDDMNQCVGIDHTNILILDHYTVINHGINYEDHRMQYKTII